MRREKHMMDHHAKRNFRGLVASAIFAAVLGLGSGTASMVAANAYLGDLESAKSHAETLKAFAPDFLPAVLSGKIEVCKLPEHNKLFVEGLRRAGL